MKKLNKIINTLESLFPLNKSEEWDNSGLQYGHRNQSINKIIVALDLTTDVFEKAIDNQVDLIITHHPFLWEDTMEENYNNAPYKKLINGRLENTGIAVYSLHTNYDQDKKGTSYRIAKMLTNSPLSSKVVKYASIIEGNTNIKKVSDQLREITGITTLISNQEEVNKTFDRFAILAGSGNIKDIIALSKSDNTNLVVTSDFKWSDWTTIKELGLNVIEVTHGIETIFSEDITNILKNKFSDLEVFYEHSQEIAKL